MDCMLWEQVSLLALGRDLMLKTLIISQNDSHVPNLPNYQFSWDGSYELICCDIPTPLYENLPLMRCLKGLSHVCLSLFDFGIVLYYKVLLPMLYQAQVLAKGTESDVGNTCDGEGRKKVSYILFVLILLHYSHNSVWNLQYPWLITCLSMFDCLTLSPYM